MKINIGVFFGGKSVEHEISVITAMQAIAAFDREKYNIVPVYITKDNEFYTSPSLTKIELFKDTKAVKAASVRITLVRRGDSVCLVRFPHKSFKNDVVANIDLACPFVHGTFSEDGTLAAQFELLDLPYTSADLLSSAIGMNKYVMKCVLKENSIPVLDCVLIRSKQFFDDKEGCFARAQEKIGLPMIVKPVNLGSSVGIGIARDREEFFAKTQIALSFADAVLVERAVTNLQEINCSALGDCDEVQTSVCEEPISGDEILSYNDKYLSGNKAKGMESTKRRLPAQIPSNVEREIRDLAGKTFQALNCTGVVRIDFIIDKDNGGIYVNEINTIPGSLAFYLWEATGMNYRKLLDNLIKLALKRQRMRQRLNFSLNVNILSASGSKSY